MIDIFLNNLPLYIFGPIYLQFYSMLVNIRDVQPAAAQPNLCGPQEAVVFE